MADFSHYCLRPPLSVCGGGAGNVAEDFSLGKLNVGIRREVLALLAGWFSG